MMNSSTLSSIRLAVVSLFICWTTPVLIGQTNPFDLKFRLDKEEIQKSEPVPTPEVKEVEAAENDPVPEDAEQPQIEIQEVTVEGAIEKTQDTEVAANDEIAVIDPSNGKEETEMGLEAIEESPLKFAVRIRTIWM